MAGNSGTERTFERHGERRARAGPHRCVCTAPIARHAPARAMMRSNARSGALIDASEERADAGRNAAYCTRGLSPPWGVTGRTL